MPVWLYAFVLWPAVTGILNLVIANETRERAWVSAHPRAAVVLLYLDAFGLNPWRVIATLRDWWGKKGPPSPPKLAIVACLALCACASPFRAACTPEAGAVRVTRYMVDVAAACAPYKGRADWRDACKAYAPLRAAFDRDRLAWEQCR